MKKRIIRNVAYNVFSFINSFVPKENKVFIYGGEKLLDNSEAMLRYLADNTNIKIECIAENRIEREGYSDRVEFKKNTFINAALSMITSKVVLDSSLHTIKMKPKSNQLFLQMWHGSPLKSLPKNKKDKNGKYYSFICYSSNTFKNEMMHSFGVDDKKMLLMGNPRNDYLFEKTSIPKEFQTTNKIIMWLPTFRQGIGLIESSKSIPIITKENVVELDEHLKKNRLLLYIKPHPLQIDSFGKLFNGYQFEAIRFIKDSDLIRNKYTLYEFLGITDALITDYSSVYFDYLLLNRPIGFAIDDIDEYAMNRGFALESPEEFMPGKIIRNYRDLEDFLSDIANDKDTYGKVRTKINEVVNYYRDNNNRKRCANVINEALGGK